MNLTVLTPSPARAEPQTTRPRRHARRFNCPRELHDADEVQNVRIETLRRDGFPRASLPLDVHIASTSNEDGHTVYHVTVTSQSTQHSWVMSYRYRQFLCLKTRVTDSFTCHSPKCHGSCPAIREILESLFPRPRLITSALPYVVQSRARAFENVLRYLLGSVLLPGSTMKCTEARGGLTTVLFQFLRVVEPLDQRTLLQVYADNHNRKADANTSATIATECIVCLEELNQTTSDTEEATAVMRLACEHAFHRDCLFEWLVVETHCPMCRSPVGPKAVAQYCLVQGKNAYQWWLADFAENPLA